jgi:hypothetical protein
VRGLRKEFPQFRKDPVLAVDKVNTMRRKLYTSEDFNINIKYQCFDYNITFGSLCTHIFQNLV